MNHDPTFSATAHDEFWRATTAADKALGAQIAEIRRQEDLGQLTVREGADARVDAMTKHLAATKALREKWLGGV